MLDSETVANHAGMKVRELAEEAIWRRYDATEARLTAPLSERMLDLAGVGPGMRVLDLASGRGEPAIRAARRVGEGGHVLGVDVSEPMLRMARERAAGLSTLELRIGNAEALEGISAASFDAATIRWGLMYMSSPIAALASARRALKAEGVLVAALWAEPARVPYFTLPRRILEAYRAVPRPDLDVPGTFRYSDVPRIEGDFLEAGLTITHVEEMDVPVIEAQSSAELVAWARLFSLGRLLDEVSESDQRSWEVELTRELEKLRKGSVIQLGGITRIVVARPGSKAR